MLFFFLEWQTKQRKKKERKNESHKIKLNHEINFLYVNLFGPIIFSAWFIKVMIFAIKASIGIL